MAHSANPSLPIFLFCAASAAPGLMKVKGIHHCKPQCFQPLTQQLLLKSCWWFILAMKLPQFPREAIKWLPGRLQGWISKAKTRRPQYLSLLPPPGCKGGNMAVALSLKGEEIFWAGKAQAGRTISVLPTS